MKTSSENSFVYCNDKLDIMIKLILVIIGFYSDTYNSGIIFTYMNLVFFAGCQIYFSANYV